MTDSRLAQISALVDNARTLAADLMDELGASQARVLLGDLRARLNESIQITNQLKANDVV